MKCSKGIRKNLLGRRHRNKIGRNWQVIRWGLDQKEKEESHRWAGRSRKGVGRAVKIKFPSDFSSVNSALGNAPSPC